MADCNETLRELERFLDHELPPAAHKAVQGHLDGCLDCLHAFDFQAEFKQVIAAKCNESDEELPPSLLAKIEACFGLDEEDLGLID